MSASHSSLISFIRSSTRFFWAEMMKTWRCHVILALYKIVGNRRNKTRPRHFKGPDNGSISPGIVKLSDLGVDSPDLVPGLLRHVRLHDREQPLNTDTHLKCTMHNSVQCTTVCTVQCAVCSVQCAVCSVQCAVCSVQLFLVVFYSPPHKGHCGPWGRTCPPDRHTWRGGFGSWLWPW